jgi:hypothetical protein
MPPELSVTPLPPGAHTTREIAANTTDTTPAGAAPSSLAVAPGQQFPNPRLRLDPGLGMVVIEFRDDGGEVTNSIPSQRQLDAYRMHQEAPGTAQPDTPTRPQATPPPENAPRGATEPDA